MFDIFIYGLYIPTFFPKTVRVNTFCVNWYLTSEKSETSTTFVSYLVFKTDINNIHQVTPSIEKYKISPSFIHPKSNAHLTRCPFGKLSPSFWWIQFVWLYVVHFRHCHDAMIKSSTSPLQLLFQLATKKSYYFDCLHFLSENEIEYEHFSLHLWHFVMSPNNTIRHFILPLTTTLTV